MKVKTAGLIVFGSTLLLSFGLSFGQGSPMAQGKSIVAGAFAFSSAGGDLYEEDNDRLTTIQFNPSFSYFVAPGLAIGGKLLYSRLSLGGDSQTAWGLGPQILYFFGDHETSQKAKGTTYPYVGASFVFTKTSAQDFFGEFDASGNAINFGGGLSHMLSETVGLFGELSYEMDSIEDVDGNKINVVGGFLIFL